MLNFVGAVVALCFFVKRWISGLQEKAFSLLPARLQAADERWSASYAQLFTLQIEACWLPGVAMLLVCLIDLLLPT